MENLESCTKNRMNEKLNLRLSISPAQAKSPHGGVRCSQSAYITQLCCDFYLHNYDMINWKSILRLNVRNILEKISEVQRLNIQILDFGESIKTTQKNHLIN